MFFLLFRHFPCKLPPLNGLFFSKKWHPKWHPNVHISFFDAHKGDTLNNTLIDTLTLGEGAIGNWECPAQDILFENRPNSIWTAYKEPAQKPIIKAPRRVLTILAARRKAYVKKPSKKCLKGPFKWGPDVKLL